MKIKKKQREYYYDEVRRNQGWQPRQANTTPNIAKSRPTASPPPTSPEKIDERADAVLSEWNDGREYDRHEEVCVFFYFF